jgi:mono/diheme cytochrome c family protein
LRDLRGQPIRSANLTPDEESGIGRWSEEAFRRALQDGFRPDGSPIRYPMVPLPELSAEESGAIDAYLRTVPKIRNSVPRQPQVAGASSKGGELYEKYACVSCHGDNGIGIADLRQASTHFRTPAALEGWIKDAPRIQPGTKMPGFSGVIPENDYPPLIDYVLQLGSGSGAR